MNSEDQYYYDDSKWDGFDRAPIDDEPAYTTIGRMKNKSGQCVEITMIEDIKTEYIVTVDNSIKYESTDRDQAIVTARKFLGM